MNNLMSIIISIFISSMLNKGIIGLYVYMRTYRKQLQKRFQGGEWVGSKNSIWIIMPGHSINEQIGRLGEKLLIEYLDGKTPAWLTESPACVAIIIGIHHTTSSYIIQCCWLASCLYAHLWPSAIIILRQNQR